MELLTVNETAVMVKVSPPTVRLHIAAGRLSVVQVGRAVRIRRDALEQLITPMPKADSEEDETTVPLGRPITADDSLWNIVGIIDDDGPTDVSENIHRYIADAIEDSHR